MNKYTYLIALLCTMIATSVEAQYNSRTPQIYGTLPQERATIYNSWGKPTYTIERNAPEPFRPGPTVDIYRHDVYGNKPIYPTTRAVPEHSFRVEPPDPYDSRDPIDKLINPSGTDW